MLQILQAAVNAAQAGATITVDAGAYAEQVTIGKSLTIRGAQAGIDARLNDRLNGSTAAESIVTGAVSGSYRTSAFTINADNVTIDGFTVQGETSKDLGNGAGIVIAPNHAGTKVLNNIIQNNVSGLFLANNSSTNAALIQHNVFRSNNNAGANGGRGIYTDQSLSGGNLTNVTIDANAFVNNRGGSGTTGLEAAVAFEAGTTNAQSNIRVTNNVFDGNGKAVLFFHTTGVTITGNEVTNALDKYSGTLRFEGDNHNVTIQNNTLYDNTGPAVAVDSKGVPGDSSGFVVTNNNFYGNSTGWGTHLSVVVNGDQYDGPFDASNNYWGAASGPGGDGPGTGDTVYGAGHVVSGSQWYTTKGGTEKFSPWSSTPIGTGRTPYWGAASSTNVTIQAEDYDQGGEGVAYHDTTSGNSGGQYRGNEKVDIEATSDAGGGYDVGWVAAGEWLGYTVNVPQAGAYRADFRIASTSAGATFHLAVDGQNVTGPITVPNTGGNQAWQTLSANVASLTAGTHDVRIVFDTAGAGGAVMNLNWFSLNLTTAAPTPAAPTNLTAAAASASVVNLTWQDNSSNETGFKIERQAGANGAWLQIATAAANATTYSDTTAAPGTSYNYRIRATNAAGDSGYSSTASATTPQSAATPTNLAVAALSSTQVSLAWSDGSPGVTTGFLIERSTDGVNFTQIATTGASATSYTDNSAVAGATYTYRVRANSAGGPSAPGVASTTTPAASAVVTYLSAFTWASATNGWGPVEKDMSNGGQGSGDGRTLTLNGTTYAKGLGVNSTSQIVYNLNGAYDDFLCDVGLDDEEVANGSVSFQVYADGVKVFDSGTLTATTPTRHLSLHVTGVRQLTLVCGDAGDGPDYDHGDWAGARLYSAPMAAPAPSNLTAAATSAGQINLSWAAASGGVATGYQIERSIDGVNFAQIATTPATVTTYADTGLTAGTSYTYRLRATSAGGPSAYSATAAATTLAATAPVTWLSDLAWASATNGWGPVEKDQSNGGQDVGDGKSITLNGTTYAKGLGVNAPSQIVYNLNGAYTRFLSDVGLDDEEVSNGSVTFQVYADGVKVFDSGTMTATTPAQSVDLSLAGVKQLTLTVTDAGDGPDYDHADWAGARLIG